MMSAARVKTSAGVEARLQSIPPVSWQDLRSASADQIQGYMQTLEAACLQTTLKAIEPADNTWQLWLALRQLEEIRRVSRFMSTWDAADDAGSGVS
jgi:hypothetical protein